MPLADAGVTGKSWDVFLDSFVNVVLPPDVDPDTQEGMDILWPLAIEKYIAKLRRPGEIHFEWRRYEDGDEKGGE